MIEPLAEETGDPVTVPTTMDRYSPLREKIVGPRGSRLLLAMLAAPLVVAAYVGLIVLFFLPLLGMRWMFPRHVFGVRVGWQ